MNDTKDQYIRIRCERETKLEIVNAEREFGISASDLVRESIRQMILRIKSEGKLQLKGPRGQVIEYRRTEQLTRNT